MKKAFLILLCLLTSLSSLSSVSFAGSSLTITEGSQYRISDDGEYVIGVEGVPSVSFVKEQFEDSANVSVVTYTGEIRTGKVASDDVVSQGSSSAKILIYGDVDRSASINAEDVVASMKYLCGFDVDICVPAVDVNTDTKTNSADVVLLMRYLVGADVVLGDITYPSVEFKIDSSYRIVIGENADDIEYEAAQTLSTALDSLYGQGLGNKRIITDDNSSPNEIILGKCRRQFYSKDIKKLTSEGYFYDIVKPSRIVIAGSDSEGTYSAVLRFLWDNFGYIDKYNTVNSAKIWNGSEYVNVKDSTVLRSAKNFFYTYPEDKASITLNGVAVEKYTVVPKDEIFASSADILIRNIRIVTGVTLASDVAYSGDNAIFVGRAPQGGNLSTSGLAYNIGSQGSSIYIDAFRLNVSRFAVRAFSDDYLLNSFESRDIVIEGNTLGAYNSNRLKLTSSVSTSPAPGITYIERSYIDPHMLPVKAFAVRIENGAAHLELATPGGETEISGSLAPTTAEIKTVIDSGKNVICGINADFFDLGGTNYPLGLCIKEGKVMQQSNARPWFAVMNDGSFRMGTGNDSRKYIDDMVMAVGGSHLFLRNGMFGDVSQENDFGGIRHPRSAIGWTDDGDLVLIVVDGRRPDYSNGASLTDLALLMSELGVTSAMNLDGGGSSTLAFVEDGDIVIKNSPSDYVERWVYDSIAVVLD